MLSVLENIDGRKARGLVGWGRVGYRTRKGESRAGQGLG